VQPWEVGEVLGAAWEAFKPNWAVLVFSYLVVTILSSIPGQLPNVLVATEAVDQNSPEFWTAFGGSTFVGLVIQALLYPGLIKIWVASARGQEASFGLLFSGISRSLPFAGLYLLISLAIGLGCGLLIVPGVILMCGLMPAVFYVVDADMGPIDAMSASWKATDGHKMKLFLLVLLSFVLAIAGVLACCIGSLVTTSVTMVAYAIVYLRISGRGGPPVFTPPAGYGGAPPGYGPPPGYGGPPGGYGGPPGGGGGYGPPGGGYGGPPAGGGGYGPPGGGGYGPPGGGGGYGGPPGGGYGHS
jgi:uncharacterized membrane protein